MSVSAISAGVRQREAPFSNVSGAELSNAVSHDLNGYLTKKLQQFEDTNKTGNFREISIRKSRFGMDLCENRAERSSEAKFGKRCKFFF